MHSSLRYSHFKDIIAKMEKNEGGLLNFARSYKTFGLHRGKDSQGRTGVWYKEWAPGGILSFFIKKDYSSSYSIEHGTLRRIQWVEQRRQQNVQVFTDFLNYK